MSSLRVRTTGKPQLKLAELIEETSPPEERAVCVLCYDSTTPQDPAMYMSCTKPHCLHVSCASNAVDDQTRCPSSPEQIIDLNQTEAAPGEATTKSKTKNKKQKRKQKKKH
ncbi:hypothetical protein A1O1_05548 [Capronia coronata CBS 617.96]|uniref:Uncharacterized protein n=1 Tax=Capronia coronata CBS 617.96 TaxID=1182541 RepID=W9Y7W0_9EURO|nr:uncharacterized protein A1O1_05548 [Capronia coronata CBS 617.96]EXJ88618.1 hypothetical protein A1O1_05548 [Capronia coronata CBS 617.96]